MACAAFACLIGIATSAASSTEGFRSVYYNGQKTPGLDAVFVNDSNPTIGPNGEIGFIARLLGPGVSPPDEFGQPTAFGSFLFNADGLTTLTYSGAAISGVDPSRRVEGMGAPQFSPSGHVTYDLTVKNLVTLQDRAFGVWDLSGPLLISGQDGVPRIEQAYTLSHDGRFLINVDFIPNGAGWPGIWEKRADGLFPVVVNGMAVPALSPDAHVGVIHYDGMTRDGNIVFDAHVFPSGSTAGVFALEGSTIVPLSVTGDSIGPGGPTALFPQVALLNAHDQLAIWGTVVDQTSKTAIWVRDPDGTQKVIAREGEIPVGGTRPLPGVFLMGFNDQGQMLVEWPDDGLWIYGVDGSKRAIAIVHDHAPGIQGADFVALAGWLNNRGSIVVSAQISGEGITEQNDHALWFIDPDTEEWKLLLRPGQSIDGADGQPHIVSDFFFNGALNNADQLALFVNFTDGGGAMYRIDAQDVLVPEPASISLIGAVALTIAGRRRR